ncbi:MAG: glycoside hydrolase family 16 protein [Bacteroidota bacterium]|nr:glycoside hydrolase family 16 protein [Bacteroidota bacterium]HHU96795.1 glycoside hydrolase family 16 protein [Petrimonas sp.]
MKKQTVRIMIIVLLVGCNACNEPRKTKSSAGWELVWEENFDGTQLDTSVWSKIPRGRSDWNNYMSNYEPLYEIADGKLILRGIKNNVLPNDTAPFITGGVFTKGKKAFGLGRLEIHAKLNGAVGAWPAFWMLPENGQWPRGGEIDIMERLGYEDIVYQTVHSHYTYTLKIKEPPTGTTASINPDEYNTYAVERHADSLVFFVNDHHTFTYPRIDTELEGQFPFNESDFYLLLDMQLGGSWVGCVDPETLPVEMSIDWVRFYSE